MATKTDHTQTVALLLQGVNTIVQSLISGYTSVGVARLKAEVFSSAYAAHIKMGALPEEARSLATQASESIYRLVQE